VPGLDVGAVFERQPVHGESTVERGIDCESDDQGTILAAQGVRLGSGCADAHEHALVKAHLKSGGGHPVGVSFARLAAETACLTKASGVPAVLSSRFLENSYSRKAP
jgi:hypothetical protein